MEDKKVLLSIKDLEVKFRVRGRILTAIRGISLDIYENESIAIVGESGSGKSVFTKTFAGMLDSNGFISNGDIIFNDSDLQNTVVKKGRIQRIFFNIINKSLNKNSKLELGSETYKKYVELKTQHKIKLTIETEVEEKYEEDINDAIYQATELYNTSLTYDRHIEKDKIKDAKRQISELNNKAKELKKELKNLIKIQKKQTLKDKEYIAKYKEELKQLKSQYKLEILNDISKETIERNELLTKEIYLSIGRFGIFKRIIDCHKLIKAFKKAMRFGEDISNYDIKNKIFDTVVFMAKYIDENEESLHGECVVNLSKVKYSKDWQQVRGKKIATVFQDPMTSLNPIITIGDQISTIIMKHQHVSEYEARKLAIVMMQKVGIPNAENRYDDYPFQYSGGMRQRIVIAIALSCQPKILICDEPTTALDVTIQAQILKLIKDLQKEFNYTIVFITHDLGVVANVSDRVAVLYAGQVVEIGTVEEVFYDPKHPYTWALLSSMPQLAERNTKLYSISGTPPSLYNKIVGDPFAVRNPYCLKIDTLVDPPFFKASETHFAKTWLLDPRAPHVEKPEIIKDIHSKLISSFNLQIEEE